jgi:hypothetical protein
MSTVTIAGDFELCRQCGLQRAHRWCTDHQLSRTASLPRTCPELSEIESLRPRVYGLCQLQPAVWNSECTPLHFHIPPCIFHKTNLSWCKKSAPVLSLMVSTWMRAACTGGLASLRCRAQRSNPKIPQLRPHAGTNSRRNAQAAQTVRVPVA